MPDDVRTLAEQSVKDYMKWQENWRLNPHTVGDTMGERKRLEYVIADTLHAWGEQRYREGMKDAQSNRKRKLCKCRHRSSDHRITMGLAEFVMNRPLNVTCKRCGCREYRQMNEHEN